MVKPSRSQRSLRTECILSEVVIFCSYISTMVAYPIRITIILVVTVNILTLYLVWQMNRNMEIMTEKLKLITDNNQIEHNPNDFFAKTLKDNSKDENIINPGKLQFDAGEPQRIPIAKLNGASLDNGNSKQKRSVDDLKSSENNNEASLKVVRVSGNQNFKVIKVTEASSSDGKEVKNNTKLDENDSFLPLLSGENVVSMCLWGKDRRYTAGAIRNAELISRYFPGWKLRIYTEAASDHQLFESVPKDVLAKLRSLGANLEFIDPHDTRVPPMMWRFMVADDMSVDRFIVRDTDSRLSPRDSAAVWAWEQSGKAFHCVRDHPSHAGYSVSGGMWGGKPAALREILRRPWKDLMAGYRTDYLQDMNFLDRVIWPRVTPHAYCSDSVSCDRWPSSHMFPIKRYTYEHVGQIFSPDELSRPIDIKLLRQAKPNTKCEPP